MSRDNHHVLHEIARLRLCLVTQNIILPYGKDQGVGFFPLVDSTLPLLKSKSGIRLC